MRMMMDLLAPIHHIFMDSPDIWQKLLVCFQIVINGHTLTYQLLRVGGESYRTLVPKVMDWCVLQTSEPTECGQLTYL